MFTLEARKTSRTPENRPWNRGWRRFVTDHIIDDVPEAIAFVSLTVRRQCSAAGWRTCKRRLQYLERGAAARRYRRGGHSLS
jgi:hypothetical protein